MSQMPYTFMLEPDVADCETFLTLIAYWNAKRGERKLPSRADIDPSDLRSILPSLIIFDCLAGFADFRYRLMGTGVVDAAGRDNTGKTVREVYEAAEPEFCNYYLDTLRSVATKGVMGRAKGTLRHVRREYRSADILLLPLGDPDGTVRWILTSSLFKSVGDTP